MSDEKPTRDEIVQNLTQGDRNIVADAHDIYEVNHNNIEVKHNARDGEVIIQLTGEHGWKMDADGEVKEHIDDEARRM